MRILAQQSLSLAVVSDEQVIEAVAPKRADWLRILCHTLWRREC
jgi:hypothetical protein